LCQPANELPSKSNCQPAALSASLKVFSSARIFSNPNASAKVKIQMDFMAQNYFSLLTGDNEN
jgi:hypothetical protein